MGILVFVLFFTGVLQLQAPANEKIKDIAVSANKVDRNTFHEYYIEQYLVVKNYRNTQYSTQEELVKHKPNHEGIGRFILQQILLSYAYYGWAITDLLNVQNGSRVVGSYLLISSAGFIVPFFLTRQVDVTHAHTFLSFYGATRGIYYGYLVHKLLGNDSWKHGLFLSTSVSLAGNVLGFKAVNWLNLSLGRSATVGHFGDLGILIGLCASGFLELKSTTFGIFNGTSSAAGLYLGYLLSSSDPYSRGDVYILMNTGILGAYTGITVVSYLEPATNKPYLASIIAGEILGTYWGIHLLKGQQFSSGEGLVNIGGMVGGGLFGAGICLLSGAERPSAYFTLSALGAIGGFYMTYHLYKTKMHGKKSSYNIEVYPGALLTLALAKKQHITSQQTLLRVTF